LRTAESDEPLIEEFPMQEPYESQGHSWRRPVWLALLVAASVAFSLGFACATPLAAFCAAGACTLPRRDAYYLAVMVWLVNQTVGFAFLHYPWTADCLAWGAVLGLCALLSTGIARLAIRHLREMPAVPRNAAAFLTAFAVSEAILFGVSLWLGGTQDFTAGIQMKIFAINAGAWVGLLALHWAGTLIGIASPAPSPSR
jgi:hypothetical protein